MTNFNLLALFPCISLASAHFAIEYPPWRFDTLSSDAPALNYSQWLYPCAGAPPLSSSSPNRTDWPVSGGSLKLDLHHPWTYVFVNLGLGANASSFNVSLTPEFLNVTGKGVLCLDRLTVPDGTVSEGALGSLQVVTLGENGNALYNVSFCSCSLTTTTPVADRGRGWTVCRCAFHEQRYDALGRRVFDG